MADSKNLVPSFVPDSRPVVLFVGGFASAVDKARQEPLTSDAGLVLRDLYIPAIGIDPARVAKTLAVPRTGTPATKDIDAWRGWLADEVRRIDAPIVIALGKTARDALGSLADFYLPHPNVIAKRGDNHGEVARKAVQICARIRAGFVENGKPQDAAVWDQSWSRRILSSGRYAVQLGWLDLPGRPNTAKELAKTGHPVVSLVLEGLNASIVFLLKALPAQGEPANASFSGFAHPSRVHAGSFGPCTIDKRRTFQTGRGAYTLGPATQKSLDLEFTSLDGGGLSGKYSLYRPDSQGWLLSHDTTPRLTRTRAISTLRKESTPLLLWPKGTTHERILLRSDTAPIILKRDPLKKIVYGIVMDPYGEFGAEPDSHRDWPHPAMIEQAAHEFLSRDGVPLIRLQHGRDTMAVVVESFIEPYPSRVDYLAAMAGKPHRVTRRMFGDDILHSGAWVMAVQLTPDLWSMFERGEITAFSPGGFGLRMETTIQELPRVEFIDLVPRPAA